MKEALDKAQVTNEVRSKVIAVFLTSNAPWWFSPPDYIEYLVGQLITLFTYKFEDERMSASLLRYLPINLRMKG